MNKKNMYWNDRYLLPSTFNNTPLSEVRGCIFGEESSDESWFIQDNFYNEKEEIVNDQN